MNESIINIIIDKMDPSDRELEEFNRLKHVYSVLITLFNNYNPLYSNDIIINLKKEFKNYLENQLNELKSDRIITLENTIKTIDDKESEILQSYIPTFIYLVDSNKIYRETVDELNKSPKIFYELLNIFYLKEYGKIYNIIETNLKYNFDAYWCVIL